MSEIKVYRVPQYMSKRVNVICVDGVPVCTVRGKKITNDIVAGLSGYDVEVGDGRISKLIDIYAAKEDPVLFVEKICGCTLHEYQKTLIRQLCEKEGNDSAFGCCNGIPNNNSCHSCPYFVNQIKEEKEKCQN